MWYIGLYGQEIPIAYGTYILQYTKQGSEWWTMRNIYISNVFVHVHNNTFPLFRNSSYNDISHGALGLHMFGRNLK